MEVIEQITYLLFIRRLDDAHTLEEGKALALKRPMENRVFPPGQDAKGRDFNDLRWSRVKNLAPAEMHQVVSEHEPLPRDADVKFPAACSQSRPSALGRVRPAVPGGSSRSRTATSAALCE